MTITLRSDELLLREWNLFLRSGTSRACLAWRAFLYMFRFGEGNFAAQRIWKLGERRFFLRKKNRTRRCDAMMTAMVCKFRRLFLRLVWSGSFWMLISGMMEAIHFGKMSNKFEGCVVCKHFNHLLRPDTFQNKKQNPIIAGQASQSIFGLIQNQLCRAFQMSFNNASPEGLVRYLLKQQKTQTGMEKSY